MKRLSFVIHNKQSKVQADLKVICNLTLKMVNINNKTKVRHNIELIHKLWMKINLN